jgi:DNA-binding phage protein
VHTPIVAYDGRMDVIEVVRRLRKVNNLTAFAKASGVSRASLYRVIDGYANPTLKTLQRIEQQLARSKR